MKVRILTQYEENYGDTENPYWKKKGGHEFEIEVSEGSYMYGHFEDVIKQMLLEKSHDMAKFMLLDYIPILEDPTVLSTERYYEIEGKLIK